MATLFHMSGDRILDANGDPYPGAKIYFYEAGTVTPQDSYSDNALSSARTNPVVCDANGLVPATWLKKASYKVVIKDTSDAVTIISIDNYDASDGLATIWGGTAGGTADALTLTISGITALEASRKYRFLVASDNTTTTPTININGYGAKTVVREDGTALEAGMLKSGFAREVVYLSGVDKLQMVNAAISSDADTLDGLDSIALKTHSFVIACSDEVTALTTGTAKVTFRMPYAFTVTAVRASLTTAQTSGNVFTVDINDGGTTILSTKLTIDNGEETSTTATTPAVISDTALADDAEITIDIDQVGASADAVGLKVTLVGYPT